MKRGHQIRRCSVAGPGAGRPIAVCLLVVLAVPLSAQQTRTCLVQLDSVGGAGRSLELKPGVFHQFGGGGVWAHCKGEQTKMKSDSVAWYSDVDRVDLIGRVNFQDPSVTLDAARAAYFLKDERLEAYGQVVLTNRRTGSRLTGPNLTYYRKAVAVRDTAELYASGRPRVEYRSESDSAGAEPYVINGEHVRFRGNDRAWAGGAVTIDRTDFSSKSDSANLDLGGERGEFIWHAELRGRGAAEYALDGRIIRYRMQDRKLTWVQARGLAEATSTDWRLRADTIEFDVAQQRIQSGRAWGDSTRPRALSTTYTITADSLALDAPGQRLSELRGFRKGYATSRTDSTQTDPDWMAGDTLVARFDSTAPGRRSLSQLVGRGNARAFYRVPDTQRPGAPPSFTYSRGVRIAAKFTPVGLDRVDVTGVGDGVFLEPAPPKPSPPAGTPGAPDSQPVPKRETKA